MIYVQIILPRIEPSNIAPPARCAADNCRGTRFRLHQQVVKPLRDHAHPTVIAHRYRCLSCGHTFRIYPRGVAHAPTSQRVRDLAVLLYRLGLSYAAVATLLETWKIYMCKSQVYQAVRRAGGPIRRDTELIQDLRIARFGNQPPLVRCHETWLPIELAANEREQMIVTFRVPDDMQAASCQKTIAPIAAASAAEVQLSADTTA